MPKQFLGMGRRPQLRRLWATLHGLAACAPSCESGKLSGFTEDRRTGKGHFADAVKTPGEQFCLSLDESRADGYAPSAANGSLFSRYGQHSY